MKNYLKQNNFNKINHFLKIKQILRRNNSYLEFLMKNINQFLIYWKIIKSKRYRIYTKNC